MKRFIEKLFHFFKPVAVSKSNLKQFENLPPENLLSRKNADPFRLLVEEITDYAIFMIDPEGMVTTWNKGAEKIKGYRADEIIGKNISITVLC